MKFPKKPKCYKCGGEVVLVKAVKTGRKGAITYKCNSCGQTMNTKVTSA